MDRMCPFMNSCDVPPVKREHYSPSEIQIQHHPNLLVVFSFSVDIILSKLFCISVRVSLFNDLNKSYNL